MNQIDHILVTRTAATTSGIFNAKRVMDSDHYPLWTSTFGSEIRFATKPSTKSIAGWEPRTEMDGALFATVIGETFNVKGYHQENFEHGIRIIDVQDAITSAA